MLCGGLLRAWARQNKRHRRMAAKKYRQRPRSIDAARGIPKRGKTR
jgi:hypothetical protein